MRGAITADTHCTSFRFDNFLTFGVLVWDKYESSLDGYWMMGWFSEFPEKSYLIELPHTDNLRHMWE